MFEQMSMLIFCLLLTSCTAAGVDMLYPLAGGLAIFSFYGAIRGHSARDLARMSIDGARGSLGVVSTLAAIGAMSASWRACGALPEMICRASTMISPSSVVLMSFLLNCSISLLTGTSFGTSATMGVICMSIARAAGADAFWTGGAILAGAYFGDRCSPVSSCALLVATITRTDIYDNFRRMLRGAAVPFAISCAAFAIAGSSGGDGAVPDVRAIFSREFAPGVICALPAALMLALAAARVPVRRAMAASTASALIIACAVQGSSAADASLTLIFGYEAIDSEVARLIDGGGVLSMLHVIAIVFVSSCYAGIFRGTGFLDGMRGGVVRASRSVGRYKATLAVGAAASAVSCNQTLAVMLTDIMCGELYESRTEEALDLADSAVITAPLIPWSIAGSVPLTTVGAPLSSIAAAVFLYTQPLWRVLWEIFDSNARARYNTKSMRK